MAETTYKFDDPEAAFAEAEDRIQQALMSGAEELDLSFVGLTEIPASLNQLSELRELRLYGNRLATLPSFLGGIKQLKNLFLNDNKLSSLPESICQLTQLRDLNLGGNKLTELPENIGRLRALETFALHQNLLTALPHSFCQLENLCTLFLDRNQLTSVPDSICHLSQLRELDLSYNRLDSLPKALRKLVSLKSLGLQENSALGLPSEVLGATWDENQENGLALANPADILDYYFRVRVARRPLNEAKLILLGRGEVGKTCVVNRLVHDKYVTTSMTRGIAITQWSVANGKDAVRLHVWDFGGQEIQHATHQFFLTERSLYVVVLNGRAGAEDEDAEYWLKFVKTFGASSPSIVVLNKFKVQPFQVNRRALLEKYPFIRAFVETDCKPKSKNGIPELKREIESALATMEHVRTDFPAGWFEIKERLAEMKEPFIAFADYRKICAGLGENDAQAQERLAGFLNALGVALNFREDPQLREETVLNPHWITEGVYQIITSKGLAERQGELRQSDLARLLPKKAYPLRMHGFLIELMRKFELCFPFHDDPAEHRYLVPELLGKEEPALKESFPPGECLNFRYDYRLMPEGLLPRFITRTHTMSEPSERWRTGVVLRWEGCRALVKADKQDRFVVVRVLGKYEKSRRLLAVVRANLDQIHGEMKEFRPTEWVGVEKYPDEWLSCKELEAYEHRQINVMAKSAGDELLTVNVAMTLDRTDVPGARNRSVGNRAQRPLKLFISYAHMDEKWRVRLKPNLELLQREGLIEIWSDRQIVPGSKWNDEIQRKLHEADLYLFLMSTHLLNSSYVREKELPAALKRYEEKQAGFVPVVVQRCSWKKYVGEIQGLPSGGKPVSDWKPFDNACFDVEEGLRKAIADFISRRGK